MIVNIKCNQIDSATCFCQFRESAISFFQFFLEIFIKICGQAFEICVNRIRRIILLYLTSFINQRYSDLIFNCSFHRIAVNRSTELCIGILLFRSNQRRSGKSNQRCIWQHFSHIVVHCAILRTMRLINENIEFITIGFKVAISAYCFKFVDKSSDNQITLVLENSFQAFACCSSDGSHL